MKDNQEYIKQNKKGNQSERDVLDPKRTNRSEGPTRDVSKDDPTFL
jgi:hypothetical protein